MRKKRKLLNGIVHPAVREKMNDWKEDALAAGKNTIIYDIPLLFESKLTHLVNRSIVVMVDEKVQLQRLLARNKLTEMEAKARIASQLPLRDKIGLADAVIDNNGSLDETEQQVDQLIKKWHLIP